MENSEQILLNKLANVVKIRRNELNISQEKLAEICNFDRTYISLIERAKRNPTYLNLEKLCIGLDIKLYKLLENMDE
ncbi:helix-turn-helix domain-containing protein [Arcobacter sp.]|uniref:helix-turn-helix domain-containing protein n=1 Tax=Arcobacter sp. TaxID=1872629 RepID=UPI003D0EC850